MERAITALLILAGLINFYPVIGVVSAEVLAGFYGIPAPEGDLLILMRHRAILFGILGAFLIASAFKRHLQPAAISAGLISMLGFIALAVAADEYGVELHQAVIADLLGSVGLVAAMLLRMRKAR